MQVSLFIQTSSSGSRSPWWGTVCHRKVRKSVRGQQCQDKTQHFQQMRAAPGVPPTYRAGGISLSRWAPICSVRSYCWRNTPYGATGFISIPSHRRSPSAVLIYGLKCCWNHKHSRVRLFAWGENEVAAFAGPFWPFSSCQGANASWALAPCFIVWRLERDFSISFKLTASCHYEFPEDGCEGALKKVVRQPASVSTIWAPTRLRLPFLIPRFKALIRNLLRVWSSQAPSGTPHKICSVFITGKS